MMIRWILKLLRRAPKPPEALVYCYSYRHSPTGVTHVYRNRA